MGSGVSSVKNLLGGPSTSDRAKELLEDFEYYIPNVNLTSHDLINVENSWNIILHNNVPDFIFAADPDRVVENQRSIFFYEAFARVAFELDSSSKNKLFLDTSKLQIPSITRMITKVVEMLKDDNAEAVRMSLRGLAFSHFDYGARSHYYPQVCKIFILALMASLDDLWDDDMNLGWVQVISFMLDCLVPAALEIEGKFLRTKRTESASTVATAFSE